MNEQPSPEPDVPAEAQEAQAAVPTRAASSYVRRTALVVLLVLVLVPLVLTATGSLDLLAQSILFRLTNAQPLIEADEVRPPTPRAPALDAFTFEKSAFHPDRVFQPYFGLPLDELPNSKAAARLIPPFRDLLDLYVQRQREDDNFTIRVYDERDGRVLELFALEKERRHYEQTGLADWRTVDKLRREETGRLVKKYEQRGIPKDVIRAKWGRANQVREARVREAPFIEYEIRLARFLDLSLLVTEIGTVETFNNDRLISSVGARGRYQMMPYVLRQYDINHYKLLTAYGKKVEVVEEWHPLLTMEPAFRLLRAYVNAVGHEVPGLSAYHTGPGNLFKIFQLFLTEQADLLTTETSVMDAYLWALTDGYDLISNQTSFKSYSRGYVASGYGSLRAVEAEPIDTTATFLAERVQLKPDRAVYLSDLLRTLAESEAMLYWGPQTASLSLYERFRRLNQHIDLPPSPEGGVPREGDVRLVAQAGDATVRFFLPLNASAVLALRGLDLIDEQATFRFDHNTYRRPDTFETTQADREYAELIKHIENLGFSEVNRNKLDRLAQQFEALAARDPSHYRLTQLDIIRQHQRLWRFAGWVKLAATTRAAKGALRLPVRPPEGVQKLPVRPPTPRTGR